MAAASVTANVGAAVIAACVVAAVVVATLVGAAVDAAEAQPERSSPLMIITRKNTFKKFLMPFSSFIKQH
jgi:F0F1-type ATP synthase membrane subunit c/vacuolar-type H+-ATPase subunit K